MKLLTNTPHPDFNGPTVAINDFGLIDNGAKRTRQNWLKWAIKRANFNKAEKSAGFAVFVSCFSNEERGTYYRIGYAGQPTN